MMVTLSYPDKNIEKQTDVPIPIRRILEVGKFTVTHRTDFMKGYWMIEVFKLTGPYYYTYSHTYKTKEWYANQW